MYLKKIQEADVSNKRVLLRVDFNVAIENEDAREKYKIEAAKESVSYLLSKNCKVALISHLGRPEGKFNKEFTLKPIADDVERILEINPHTNSDKIISSAKDKNIGVGIKVKFIDDCIGEKVKEGLNNLQSGEVLLLENVRFYEGEEKNDPEFSKKLAENFDIFINDAFSVCHRDQASVTGIARILPSFAGFWLQKEIENLDKMKNNPEHPAVAIIGGAKIETKLPVIQNFEKIYDYVLVGGKIANEALNQEIKFLERVILPVDYVGDNLDIGEKTTDKFIGFIKNAKTIVWNGPMGKFEEPPYDKGTKAILEAVINSGAYTLMGGGESVEILENERVMDKISFVSTGGGAMLEYLAGNPMPGIEALEE
jgi:phosphoglycerate kinase